MKESYNREVNYMRYNTSPKNIKAMRKSHQRKDSFRNTIKLSTANKITVL